MTQEIDNQEAVAEILENVRRAFKTRTEQEAIAERERQKAQAKRIGRERAAIREWLVSWLPAPLVQFVKLNDSTYDAATHYGYESSAKGVWVEVEVPGAVPVAFKLYRQDEELSFGRWPYDRYNENQFALPTMASVDRDEEGDLYIRYNWPNSPQHLDFNTALGQAIALYEEWWPALQEAWLKAEAKSNEAPVEKAPVETQERIAQALERIAGALEAQVYGY